MATAVPHLVKPSVTRLVTVDGFVPVPRGSTMPASTSLSWPPKDPTDVLDYQIEIGPALVGNEGDSIDTVDISVHPDLPGDLTTTEAVADGTRVILWLSGGQAGTVYVVTIGIGTKNGRFLQRSVFLPVLALSNPQVPMNAIETDAGLVITDQYGKPVFSE